MLADMRDLHYKAVHDLEHKMEQEYSDLVQELQEKQKSKGKVELTQAQYFLLQKTPLQQEEALIRRLSRTVLAMICTECFGK